MKIYLRLPNGTEFSYEWKPMEREKFYALVGLLAGTLPVILILGCVALTH